MTFTRPLLLAELEKTRATVRFGIRRACLKNIDINFPEEVPDWLWDVSCPERVTEDRNRLLNPLEWRRDWPNLT